MKILVCVKPVPDLISSLDIDEETGWIVTGSACPYRINRFDEFAVEEALLIKEAHPDTVVDIVTVFNKDASDVLKRCMGMGADNAFCIQDTRQGWTDPYAIAGWIADFASEREYDLILCGFMSEDLMQGLTGPFIAELLSTPYATAVMQETVAEDKKSVTVRREIEGGLTEAFEITLPALLTVQTGINMPRYPSLSNMLRANKKKIETITPEASGAAEPRQYPADVSHPSKTRAGRVLEGSPREKARELLTILKEKSII